ncbi:MAG TPA: M20/M25/M40 family metallo-hydrolase [Bryobacteraceae bacterium]|nr:M20/M25/M40 family metallo-hydrolase [Bryobacteraceae bacterium]
MLIRCLRSLLVLAVCCAPAGFGQPPVTALNPTIQQIVDAVSEERISATMKRLESFGTRYILSEQDSPTHGIGAAQRWIFDEFKSYSPRLQVRLDPFTVQKGPRVAHDVDLANVVAVLPGTVDVDRFVVISSHYDSIAFRRGPGAPRTDDAGPRSPQEVEPIAPGVSDNASGVAAVLELARIMSRYEFDKSVVFIAFSAEEVGLLGSRAYAAKAKQEKMQIEAVLNNDIIGTDIAGDGRPANNRVRLFSEGPEDSPSRELARYTKEIAKRYLPYITVDLVFRRDRFGRGGDHTSFNREGFAAVRLTTPSENYANEHTATDTFANASAPYATRVAKMNAAVLASLALAPKPPVVSRPRTGMRQGSGPSVKEGAGGKPPNGGTPERTLQAAGGYSQATSARPLGPGISRGKTGYDAALRWEMPKPEPDIAGYAIVIRATTSPLWEREIYVGNVTEYTIPDLSIDDVVIGVKAVDKDGNQSLVSPYELPATSPARQEGGVLPSPAITGGGQ